MPWRQINALITLAVALFATAGPLSAKFDPSPKTASSEILELTSESVSQVSPQTQQPRRENSLTVTVIVSGIPCWLSRDPIGLRGGVNLSCLLNNDSINKADLLGQIDISVVLRRESTGFVNTYGDLKVAVSNDKIKKCCKFTQTTWNILELPWGYYSRRRAGTLLAKTNLPMRSSKTFYNASLQNASFTSPQALASIIGGQLPAKPSWLTTSDYNDAISKAFNTREW